MLLSTTRNINVGSMLNPFQALSALVTILLTHRVSRAGDYHDPVHHARPISNHQLTQVGAWKRFAFLTSFTVSETFSRGAAISYYRPTYYQSWLYQGALVVSSIVDHADIGKSSGDPFIVHTPDNIHVMVSSSTHVSELSGAPLHQLSLHAVAKDVSRPKGNHVYHFSHDSTQIFQPKYTMYGFEWQEKRGVEGTGFVRALRSLLTAHLPSLLSTIQSMIEESISEELLQYPVKNGKQITPIIRASKQCSNSLSGYAEAALYPVVKRVVTKANCFIFFGEELCKINP